jgi:hypothetical protein
MASLSRISHLKERKGGLAERKGGGTGVGGGKEGG